MFNSTESRHHGMFLTGFIFLSFFGLAPAHAIFQPGQPPRPHTVCLDAVTVSNAEDLLQVAVTSLSSQTAGVAETSKVEVSQKQAQQKVALASRNSSLSASANEERYVGNGLELTIQNQQTGELGQRPGHLRLQLADGTWIDSNLQCQPMLYPMSGSGL